MKPIINFILKCITIPIMAIVVLLLAIISLLLWDDNYIYRATFLINHLVWGDKL